MRRKGARALRGTAAASIVGALSLAPSTARAEEPRVHELRYDVGLDLAVIGGSVALVLGTELLAVVKPRSCRWCDRSAGRDSLNGVDRWARSSLLWREPREAQLESNLTAFLLEPAAAGLTMYAAGRSDKAARAVPVDYLLVGEAIAVSALLNQTAKIVFARERPFVHQMSEAERAKTSLPTDNNVSFYSGHTSVSFALATAAGTVAALRGYRLMPLVWSTLLPLAALTGYLRIAGDKHYFADVVVGMLIGSAVGVALPLAFHGRRGDDLVGVSGGGGSGTAQQPLRAAPQMITIGGGF
jgi:membrane-associated phospholipid phosphatase